MQSLLDVFNVILINIIIMIVMYLKEETFGGTPI